MVMKIFIVSGIVISRGGIVVCNAHKMQYRKVLLKTYRGMK